MPRGSSLRVNKLSIYSAVILPTTNYVISVETTAGNWTILFSITAKECQYGTNTVLSTSSDLVATLSYNGTVYAQGYNIRVFCIPLCNYHYMLHCSTSSFSPDCLVTIYHMNSALLHRRILAASTVEGDFETVETHAPVISFPSLLALTDGYGSTIQVGSTGVVRNVTI